MKFPVCDKNIKNIEDTQFCPQCGWELIVIPNNSPDELKKFYQKKENLHKASYLAHKENAEKLSALKESMENIVLRNFSSTEDFIHALCNVKKAHRLIYTYQPRMLDLVYLIKSKLGFPEFEGWKKFSNAIKAVNEDEPYGREEATVEALKEFVQYCNNNGITEIKLM
jgi:glycosyltransferase involved in cell wall biosynthesis